MTTDASDRLVHGRDGTGAGRLPAAAGRPGAASRLAALAAFTRASGGDADTIARTAVELLQSALGASHVEMLGTSDGAGKVTVRAGTGDADEPWARVAVGAADLVFVRMALAALGPLVVTRLQKDARFVASERFRALGATSVVAAPVRAGPRAFGVLCAYRSRRFSAAEVDFIATFAAVVALDTERARLQARLDKRAQETRRLRELIELVTENLPVALAYCDADTVYRWANSRHAERHGLTPEQIIGRRVPELWGEPVYSSMIAPHIARVLAGETVSYERPIRLHDGSIRESTIHLTPAIGLDGRVEGFASLTLDITDRRRVERALEGAEVSRRFLASIVEQSLDCILTRDFDDVITSWNPGAARLLGWTAQEAIGKRSRDLHLRYMPGVRYERMLERIRKGEPAQFEVTWHTREGNQRFVLSTFAPMHDDAGRHIGEIVIARDVSELHEARAALENLNNELERRVDERTGQLASAHKEAESLSYSIAHDLRAPLRAISGYTRILTQELGAQVGREARDYLDRVAANAERMGTLIDALLSFGHLARQPLARSLVDLNEAAGDALGWLTAEQADRSLEIELGELGTAQADPALIRVALANLLSNALKFTRGRTPARIEIGRMAGDGEWIYFVRDNGAGFDMRYVDKLFGVFQRLHGVKEFEGSGVGLASVQRIAQRHGGRVWAQGEVDRGATFYFTLGRT